MILKIGKQEKGKRKMKKLPTFHELVIKNRNNKIKKGSIILCSWKDGEVEHFCTNKDGVANSFCAMKDGSPSRYARQYLKTRGYGF